MDREFRVLAAVQGGPVPLPRVPALCLDTGVTGAAFFVMDDVPGRVLGDPRLPGWTAPDRADLFAATARTLAALVVGQFEITK